MYYRNSEAAILVYDISNLESFNVLKLWHEEIQNNVPNCLVFIVGNKLDLEEEGKREVDRSLVEEYAKEHNLPFFEASSKTGHNINDIFTEIGVTLTKKYSHE